MGQFKVDAHPIQTRREPTQPGGTQPSVTITRSKAWEPTTAAASAAKPAGTPGATAAQAVHEPVVWEGLPPEQLCAALVGAAELGLLKADVLVTWTNQKEA